MNYDPRSNTPPLKYGLSTYLVCLLFFWLPSTLLVAQDKSVLKYDALPGYQPGQTSRFETFYQRTKTTLSQVAGRETTVTEYLTVTSEVDWKVIEKLPENRFKCQMKYQWIKMTSRQNEEEADVIDTRHQQENPGYDFLKAITDTTYIAICQQDGSIVDVEGVQDMKERMDERMRDSAPDKIDFIEAAGELGLIGSMPSLLSSKSIWEHTYNSNQDISGLKVGSCRETVKYQVEKIETLAGIPTATISGTGKKVFTQDLSEIPDAGDMKVTVNYPPIKHKIYYDLQRGEVVGRSVTLNCQKVTTRTLKLGNQSAQFKQTVDSDEYAQVLRIKEGDQ